MAARAFRPDLDPSSKTNPDNADTDGDGLRDGAEDWNHDGKQLLAVNPGDRWEGDPLNQNSPIDKSKLLDGDGDGLPDWEEQVLGTRADDPDSDDDGVYDGAEWNLSLDPDRDGAPCASDPDSDNDGLSDGLERGIGAAAKATWMLVGNFRSDADTATTSSPLLSDSDGDGVRDGLEDANGNGMVDAGESDPLNPAQATEGVDSDGDGLADSEELRCGTSSQDRDSDDDGVADGAEANACSDFDLDGLVGALDADSDDDGLLDGTEAGVAQAIADAAPLSGTDVARGRFIADAAPLSHTLPLSRDSDGDGQLDANEDYNRNGAVDQGEGDAADPDKQGQSPDSDKDGLCDALESNLQFPLQDGDADDDGVPDGAEANYALDSDGDGQVDGRDEDSDGDGLYDGTEIGLTEATLALPEATAKGSNVFIADADPSTRTLPRRADSDGGGLADGQEDFSHDGKVTSGESDPQLAADDLANDGDFDGDTLANELEVLLGTDPLHQDSDKDGLLDATEVRDPQKPADTDGDGQIDALDADSDNDLLPDVVEAGLEGGGQLPQKPLNSDGDAWEDYRDVDSDGDRLPDGDEVLKYGTNPRKADTDGGGLDDATEVLQTQTDPLNPKDDAEVLEYGAVVRGTSPLSACQSSPSQGSAPPLALLGLLSAWAVLRRRRRENRPSLSPPGAALALLLMGAALMAASPSLAANLPDTTGLRQNSDGQGILGTESAYELAPYGLSAGAQLHYAYRPLVAGNEVQVIRPLVEGRLQADLSAAMRIWDHLTVAAALPISLYQEAERPSLYGSNSGPLPSGPLVGDAMITAKYVFAPEAKGSWGGAALLTATLPTGDPGQYFGRPGVTVAPGVAASKQAGPWRLAMGASARLQQTTASFNVQDGPAWRWSAAASLSPAAALVSWKEPARADAAWIDASVTHETSLASPFGHRHDERIEGALALTWPLGEGLSAQLGSTMGLWSGFGVPAVRPFLLIRYGGR
jgi:uncharacterized protein (TIGR03382 family)